MNVEGQKRRRGALRCADVEACVEHVLGRVGKRIVLSLPLGIGKPNQLANAFVRRAWSDPSIDLVILTALTLGKPRGSSELERRLIEPIAERLYSDYPPLEYDEALRRGDLPRNIRVSEFFFTPGSRLAQPASQQSYVSSNYTHALRDALARGLNVLAQLVGREEQDGEARYSFSGNTDVTLDLLPELDALEARGKPTAIVAQVNRRLPFLGGEACAGADTFDAIVDDPALDFEPFSIPNEPVTLADAAIGLRASALIRDGGTLQLGIGTLSDAFTHALLMRHRRNEEYLALFASLGAPGVELVGSTGGFRPFERGLYAATEMFGEELLELQRADILKRAVYEHPLLQRLADAGELDQAPSLSLLDRFVSEGVVPSRLRANDVELLRSLGVLHRRVSWREGRLKLADGSETAPELADKEARAAIARAGLGERLNGAFVHAGFFVGPRSFYQAMRDLPSAERERIHMTRISFVNQLYGGEELKRAQRRDSRSVNTALMATCLGAAVSDGLEDGRVISGVGGQYNFVSMAHALDGGRSILLVRSTRERRGRVESNIVWSYGHETIPRHLRDIVITEYGTADLRGRSDAEVARAMIEIADARFQPLLIRTACRAGKLPPDFRLEDRFRQNTPERLERALGPHRASGLLPDLPFGSDLTREEIVLASALRSLREAWKGKRGLLPSPATLRKTIAPPAAALPYLERMRLDRPRGLRERMLRLGLLFALARDGSL